MAQWRREGGLPPNPLTWPWLMCTLTGWSFVRRCGG
jgi:hypothetical protein